MIIVAALYQFVKTPHFKSLQEPLKKFCSSHDIKGTLLLANEGINGTIASQSRKSIDALYNHLQELGFTHLEYKESFAESMPFYRLKIKLKKEIVTLGVDGIDPNQVVGTYVSPKEWNALISRPDVLTVDTRNDYEVNIGTFKGAIDPKTSCFTQFRKFTEKELLQHKEKPIAMFCTGGIRCEKSTAYLKSLGFKEVYHLKGGILKYLEEIPKEESLWEGECFVFDQRTAVRHNLELGSYEQCHGCRMPINETDKNSTRFKEGVYCPHCYDKYEKDHYTRMAERQHQIELAKKRGIPHIGSSKETRPAKNHLHG